MPVFHTIDPALLPKTSKNKYPLWTNAKLCQTAELADGIMIGSRLEHTQNHMLNYRLNGPCHWSPLPMMCGNTVVTNHDGILYIPINMPPTRTASDRSIALWIYTVGPTSFSGTESHIKWRQTFGSGAWTTLFAETYGGPSLISVPLKYVITYTPPSGTGTDSLKCLEVKFQNLNIKAVAAYHLPLRYLDADQYLDAPGDCSPGRYICDRSSSFGGLVEAVGTGADDVESMERLTRRVFFNQSHVFGSYIKADAAWQNMLGKMSFGPRCRDLDGQGDPVNCVPCAVIECTGQDDLADIQIRFRSPSSTKVWTYTVQAADATTPIFVHPWSGAGSSTKDGVSVYSDADDSIEIDAKIVSTNQHAQGTITLRGWALFEGTAWSTP